jgi:hypothetical protein
MSDPAITYAPRPDATPEAEISALAAIYKLCISSHAKKRGHLLDKGGPDDARKDSDAGTFTHCT